MTIVTPVPFLRRRHHFGGGDLSGSLSAHEDLLIWSLKINICQRVLLLIERQGLMDPKVASATSSAIGELPRDLAARMRLCTAGWFASEGVQADSMVAVGKAMDFASLAHLRAQSSYSFPISCVVHAVLFPHLVSMLLSSVVHTQPYDRFIATSRTGLRAMEDLLTKTREQLTGVYPSLRASEVVLPRVALAPLGVDDLYTPADRGEARTRFGVPNEATVLLWVGRLTEHYKADLDPLLPAFRTLRQQSPRLHLVLAGNASYPHYSAPQVARSDQITVIENFLRADKPFVYGRADIFVSPVDNIQETFGLTVLEAMASGLPVVASDWSGYRDLVVDNETGYLIRTVVDDRAWEEFDVLASFAASPVPEYHLARQTVVDVDQLTARLTNLVDVPSRRSQFGMAGRERVAKHFLWSKVIRDFGSVWEEQMAEFASAPPGRLRGISFRDVFRLYGTAPSSHRCLIVSSRASDVAEYRRAPSSVDAGVWVLEQCLDSSVPFDRFAESGEQVRQAALGLLKKGFLRVTAYVERSAINR